jgi:hypothetical protein
MSDDVALRFSNTQFAYWLQGAMEIGPITTFSDLQVTRILEALTSLCEPMDSFAQMVHATLHGLRGSAEPAALQAAFSAIYAPLQAKFIHDVDPSYAGDQEFYHLVHRGLVSPV